MLSLVDPELARQGRGLRRRCGSRSRRSAPALRSAHTAARAEPPAPSTSARLSATGAAIAPVIPTASVFSAATPRRRKLSVFAAPISRAASEASVATASAASLCGTVTLTPAKPRRAATHQLGEVLGGTSIAS